MEDCSVNLTFHTRFKYMGQSGSEGALGVREVVLVQHHHGGRNRGWGAGRKDFFPAGSRAVALPCPVIILSMAFCISTESTQ